MRNEDRRTKTMEEIFEGVYGYKKRYRPMKADLSGRVAVLTGASGMIGGAAASLYAMSGARVVIWDIGDEAGEKKAGDIRAAGGDAAYMHVDLGDREAVRSAFDAVISGYGRIDVLLANAGVNTGNRKPVTEFDEELFDRNIDFNLKDTLFLIRLALPGMIRQRGGSIVITTSVCGVTGLRRQCGFVASKFALGALTRSLAMEYAKFGIRVNALAPGSLPRPGDRLNFLWDTCDFDDYERNFSDPSTMVYDIPMRRPAFPDDMAGILLYFASDDACYTTGQVVCVDGGWTAGLSGDY